jgi:hypothetical protein
MSVVAGDNHLRIAPRKAGSESKGLFYGECTGQEYFPAAK